MIPLECGDLVTVTCHRFVTEKSGDKSLATKSPHSKISLWALGALEWVDGDESASRAAVCDDSIDK